MLAGGPDLRIVTGRGQIESEDLAAKVFPNYALDGFAESSLLAALRKQSYACQQLRDNDGCGPEFISWVFTKPR